MMKFKSEYLKQFNQGQTRYIPKPEVPGGGIIGSGNFLVMGTPYKVTVPPDIKNIPTPVLFFTEPFPVTGAVIDVTDNYIQEG